MYYYFMSSCFTSLLRACGERCFYYYKVVNPSKTALLFNYNFMTYTKHKKNI